MNSFDRLTSLLRELPARLVVSLGLVGVAGLVHLLFPFFRRSPQLFALLELVMFLAGIWAYHLFYRQNRRAGTSDFAGLAVALRRFKVACLLLMRNLGGRRSRAAVPALTTWVHARGIAVVLAIVLALAPAGLAWRHFLLSKAASEGTERRPAPAPPLPASGTQSITEPITGMRLWYVRRGRYMLGSPGSEPLRDPNELRHSVRLTYDFWIGETEVTQQQWMEIIGHNPAYFADMAKYPVELINWYEAVEFANRLSERSYRAPCYVLKDCQGRLGHGLTCGEVTFVGLDCTGYRLPTEAEWEIAARAGSAESFSTGSTLTTSQANYDGARPYPPGVPSAVYHGRPVEVNHYQPNAWSLYQMHGNLYEWTWDRFAPYPGHSVTDPTGPQEGDKRVARGGSYRSGARFCRSAARWGVDPGERSKEIGLRLVRTAQ